MMRVGEERDTGSKSQGLILSESENREHRSSVTLTQQKRSFAIQRGKHNSLTSAAHFLSPEWNKEEGNWGNSPTPLGPIMSVSQGVYVNPVGGGSSGHPYIHPSKPKPPKVPSLRVKLSAMNATSKVASSKVETRKIGNTVLLPRDLQFYSQFKLYESTRAKEFGEATEPYMFLDIGGISLPPLHSPNIGASSEEMGLAHPSTNNKYHKWKEELRMLVSSKKMDNQRIEARQRAAKRVSGTKKKSNNLSFRAF